MAIPFLNAKKEKKKKKKRLDQCIVEMVTIKRKGYTNHLLIYCYTTVFITNQKH